MLQNQATTDLGIADQEGTVEDRCLEFAQTLGLQQPVPVAVLEAALRDEAYARNLLASRRSPMMMKVLLAKPPRARSGGAGAPRFSNAELAGKAAQAILRWAKVGFSTVDEEILEQRLAACSACPHLIDAPDQMIYKLTSKDEAEKFCELCGCSARKKAKLPTETCPDPHPEKEGVNRWGEPL